MGPLSIHPPSLFSLSPDSDKNGPAPRKPQSGDRGEAAAVAAVPGEADEAGAGLAGPGNEGRRAGRREQRAAAEPETAAERLEKRRGLGHGDAETQPAQPQ